MINWLINIKSIQEMKWKSISVAAVCVIVGLTTDSPLSEQLPGIAVLWLKLSTQNSSKVCNSCRLLRHKKKKNTKPLCNIAFVKRVNIL